MDKIIIYLYHIYGYGYSSITFDNSKWLLKITVTLTKKKGKKNNVLIFIIKKNKSQCSTRTTMKSILSLKENGKQLTTLKINGTCRRKAKETIYVSTVLSLINHS